MQTGIPHDNVSIAAAASRPLRVRYALIVAVVSMALSLIFLLVTTSDITSIPLLTFDDTNALDSVMEVLVKMVFAAAFIVTFLSYQRFARFSLPDQWFLRPLDYAHHLTARAAVAFAISMIWLGVLILSLIPLAIDRQFAAALVSRFGVVLIVTISIGVVAGVCAYVTSRITTVFLIVLTGWIFGVGLLFSVLLATNADWLTRAISFLGVDQFGYLFNAVLAVCGLLLLILMVDKLGDLSILRRRNVFASTWFEAFRIIVIVQCVAFVGIGVFPHREETSAAHQIAAQVALVITILLMLITWRAIPIYPNSFRRISYGLFGACIGAIIGHFFLSVILFSLMEIALLVAGAVWIGVFYHYTRSYIQANDPTLITGTLDV